VYANASTSGQWRGLMAQLSPRYHVLAADSYGRLVPALPRVEAIELTGLGHMGPVTHPEQVNQEIVRFLDRL
jgi:pimeloyl-ACP methyl ester carboxylesterase